jgi:hypothetical protein
VYNQSPSESYQKALTMSLPLYDLPKKPPLKVIGQIRYRKDPKLELAVISHTKE